MFFDELGKKQRSAKLLKSRVGYLLLYETLLSLTLRQKPAIDKFNINGGLLS